MKTSEERQEGWPEPGEAEAMPSPFIPRRDFLTKSLVAGIGVMGLSLLDELPVSAASLRAVETVHPLSVANNLHVCGLATNKRIFHTIRFSDHWQSNFGDVNAQEGNSGLRFSEVDCSGIASNLHVVAVAEDGVIWHTIRFSNGSWQSNFGNVNNQEGNGDSLRFSTIGCAGTASNKLHIVALAEDGVIWHTIRFSNGSWQSNFGDVNNQEGNSGLRFSSVDCAVVNEDLHIVAVAGDGVIWHTIRFSDGSWQSNFGNVNNQEGNGGLRFTEVGCAAIGGNLHIVAVAGDGVIWHTIRFSDHWQSNFGNVNNQEGNGGRLRFSDVDCANVRDTLHVVAVAEDGVIWHTIRFSDHWQSNFGNVNNQEGNGRRLRFTAVGAGGVV